MPALVRALLLITAAELAVCVLLLNAVSRASGWPLALAAAAALVIALPSVLILVTFAIAVLYRSPVPEQCRTGVLPLIVCVVKEIGAAALVYNVLIPLHALLREKQPSRLPPMQPPILLVHGYLLTSGSWWPLRRWLARHGHAVYTLDLDLFCDIDSYVDVLRHRIDAICTATGSQRVLLVGHSMGGLAVRAYLRACGTARVAGVITLGSPHHGSVLGQLAVGENGRAMRRGSPWLERLAQDEGSGWRVPMVSIYSCHDNLVAPQDSCRLDHAVNVPLAAIGHLTLPFSRRVRTALAHAIEQIVK